MLYSPAQRIICRMYTVSREATPSLSSCSKIENLLRALENIDVYPLWLAEPETGYESAFVTKLQVALSGCRCMKSWDNYSSYPGGLESRALYGQESEN